MSEITINTEGGIRPSVLVRPASEPRYISRLQPLKINLKWGGIFFYLMQPLLNVLN